MKIFLQKLEEPLFHDGFAVAAGDADHGQAEPVAMMPGKQVKGSVGVFHQNKMRPGEGCRVDFFGNDEATDALAVQVFEELVPVVPPAAQRYEHGRSGKNDLAAVEQQVLDRIGRAAGKVALYDVCYLADGVVHK